jgi:hypothetical protein
MKRSILKYCITYLLFIVLGVTLVGCDFAFFNNDNKISEDKFKSFLFAIETGNKDTIRALFSYNKINNISDFDDDIDGLLTYYQGNHSSYDYWGLGTDIDVDSGITKKWFNISYDVTTPIDVYRIAIYWCVQDTGDDANVGIWSLYILKLSADSNPDYAYRGDGQWTPGIHIAIPRPV